MDKSFLFINGVVWVDRHNDTSRNEAARQMTGVLGIDIAQKADCPIVPVCMEYYGKKVYVRFSSPIIVQSDDDKRKKMRFILRKYRKYKILEELKGY